MWRVLVLVCRIKFIIINENKNKNAYITEQEELVSFNDALAIVRMVVSAAEHGELEGHVQLGSGLAVHLFHIPLTIKNLNILHGIPACIRLSCCQKVDLRLSPINRYLGHTLSESVVKLILARQMLAVHLYLLKVAVIKQRHGKLNFRLVLIFLLGVPMLIIFSVTIQSHCEL